LQEGKPQTHRGKVRDLQHLCLQSTAF